MHIINRVKLTFLQSLQSICPLKPGSSCIKLTMTSKGRLPKGGKRAVVFRLLLSSTSPYSKVVSKVQGALLVVILAVERVALAILVPVVLVLVLLASRAVAAPVDLAAFPPVARAELRPRDCLDPASRVDHA